MGATANTTQSKTLPAGESVADWVRAEQARRQSRRAALLAGAVALGIVTLAAPRVVSEALVLSSRERIIDIQSGQETGSQVDLAERATTVETVGSWSGDGRLVTDGALLLMRQAAVTRDLTERKLLLQRAIALTEDGLRRSPAHPVGWTRLAALRVAMGEQDKAAQAFRLSLLTGPVVPQITASRIAQGLALLPHLNVDTRQLLARQVRLLEATQSKDLQALATSPEAALFIQHALTGK